MEGDDYPPNNDPHTYIDFFQCRAQLPKWQILLANVSIPLFTSEAYPQGHAWSLVILSLSVT